MRVVVVSRSLAPARNLARVIQALLDRRHQVAAVLSTGISEMINVKALMNFNPHVVLISTSAETVPGVVHNIEDELSVARESMQRGIPFTIFAESRDAYRRPQIRSGIVKSCRVLFVSDELEKIKAENAGWPNVIVSGFPLWDENFNQLSQAYYEGEAVQMAQAANKIVEVLEKII